jgi:excisionase family DNA binding protein
MENFYSTKQVAQILGVTALSVRRWIKVGLLQAIYLGDIKREYRVSEADLQKFIDSRKVKT